MLHTVPVELGADAGVPCTRNGFLFVLTEVMVSWEKKEDNYFLVIMRSLSSAFFFCVKRVGNVNQCKSSNVIPCYKLSRMCPEF